MVLTRRQSAAVSVSKPHDTVDAPPSPSDPVAPDQHASSHLLPKLPSSPQQPSSHPTVSCATNPSQTTTTAQLPVPVVKAKPNANADANADAITPELTPSSVQKKRPGDFWARFFSGMALTALFCFVVSGGHMWVGLSVVMMEIGVFNEVLRLGFTIARNGRIPLWHTTGWYFFLSLQFLLYGKLVLAHFHDQHLSFSQHPAYQYALEHHSFIAFCMYCAGFVGFVCSLRADMYHFQFTYFGRALVALILVVVQSHFMILNTSLGLIWFVLPCWLIIINDSFGYFFGRLFGRHSLIALSPKKTWEGYIGAGIFTMIAAFFLCGALSNYPRLICPRDDFTDCTFWCPPVQCNPLPQPFIPTQATLGTLPYIGDIIVTYRPVQLHAVAIGLFAASIAPFGGFFASGAKRAFGVKDFGGLLPGHGGVTDRVDCQLMMALFTYVYLINFVKVNFVGSPDVGKIMSFVTELSTPEQVELLTELYVRLKRRGVDHLLANLTNAGSAR